MRVPTFRKCADCSAVFQTAGQKIVCTDCKATRRREKMREPGRRAKNAARCAARYAIRAGRLTPQKCEVADCERGPIHAHHDDYSKPLDVRWLCAMHHRWVHSHVQQIAE